MTKGLSFNIEQIAVGGRLNSSFSSGAWIQKIRFRLVFWGDGGSGVGGNIFKEIQNHTINTHTVT